MEDPTRDELIDLLVAIDAEDGEASDFDIESAAYWIASDCHGGQCSNLYKALCQSPYKPGCMESSPEGIAKILYDRGCAWVLGTQYEDVRESGSRGENNASNHHAHTRR